MKMSEEKKKEHQLKRWSDNKERALSHKWYAISRMDLMTISISGAGIYIGFELMKFIIEQKDLKVDFLLVKSSSILFTISIIINFSSQLFGYLSNGKEAEYDNLKVKEILDEKDMKADLNNIDARVKKFNKWVNRCNVTSTVLMLLGIILLVGFTLHNI